MIWNLKRKVFYYYETIFAVLRWNFSSIINLQYNDIFLCLYYKLLIKLFLVHQHFILGISLFYSKALFVLLKFQFSSMKSPFSLWNLHLLDININSLLHKLFMRINLIILMSFLWLERERRRIQIITKDKRIKNWHRLRFFFQRINFHQLQMILCPINHGKFFSLRWASPPPQKELEWDLLHVCEWDEQVSRS